MIEQIYKIYKITNPINGKIYIGITKGRIEKRYWMHVAAANKGSLAKLHKAIRKYGKDVLKIEWICSIRGVEGALELEKYFIEKFDSFKVGYNSNEGGTGLLYHSEETKLKMKGRKTWCEGKRMNDEFKKKVSDAKKGKVSYTKTFEVKTPSGEVVIVKNMADFCREHSLSKGNMSSLSSGKIKYYKGYEVKNLHVNNITNI